MKIVFSTLVKQKLSAIRTGTISFSCSVTDSLPVFWDVIGKECDLLREKFTPGDITKLPELVAARRAYKLCGKDPSRYRPSADSLIRRIVKGNNLYKVNSVVDILNLVSIQSGFSIGGYSVSAINGKVILDIGQASDEYYGIGRGLLNIEGMPVFRDDTGVFGSPTSDSERTMITLDSKLIAFAFFDFGVSSELEKTMDRCRNYLEEYCGAKKFDISMAKL